MVERLGIVDVLKPLGFDSTLRTKLVRHQDARYGISTLIREGWFELYQSLQAKPVFKGCEQIVSFIGEGGDQARFIGVYQVLKEGRASKSIVPDECPYPQWGKNSKYHYELERREEFSDLESRLIIEWGAGALAWHQHLKNKRVIEIMPPGRSLEPFVDYLDFSLSHFELIDLVKHATAHRDWMSSLSAVAGVYLILAGTTGHQYVGSAYGTGGVWARWKQYASNGHGGNAKLRELLKSDAAYPDAFRYSVLQVLPKTTTAKEVIRWESQYKVKLGSRATGLNLN
ncbi:MAG: GIY-YIG nuclease family protein [Pirellulaceae bacterium]